MFWCAGETHWLSQSTVQASVHHARKELEDTGDGGLSCSNGGLVLFNKEEILSTLTLRWCCDLTTEQTCIVALVLSKISTLRVNFTSFLEILFSGDC